MILFLRESERLKREFDKDIDSRLKVILFALAEWLKYTKQGTLIITHLIRSQAEQDEIYLSPNMRKDKREAYQKKAWYSVHQMLRGKKGRGADISVADFKNPEAIVKWLNDNFQYSPRTLHSTAIFEMLGWGKHIHVQVSALSTKLK